MDENNGINKSNDFLYKLKASLMTETEKKYISAIILLLINGYILQPQANLTSIISSEKLGVSENPAACNSNNPAKKSQVLF